VSDEKPSHLERLSLALYTNNLTMDVNRQRTDYDYVVALGIATGRNGSVAAPLTHLHLHSTQSAYRQAHEAVVDLVKRVGSKKNWRLNAGNTKRVADLALAHHVAPACPVCSGRKWQSIPGTPSTSGAPCTACRGSGRRPVHRNLHDEITQIIAMLEKADDLTSRTIGRLLR